jgi:hypothetical protein
MNTLLWTFQIVLALVFAGSGTAKSTMSKPRLLETGQTGVRDYPLPFIRFIAVCELLGAVGLVVPWALHLVPRLTPIAAIPGRHHDRRRPRTRPSPRATQRRGEPGAARDEHGRGDRSLGLGPPQRMRAVLALAYG